MKTFGLILSFFVIYILMQKKTLVHKYLNLVSTLISLELFVTVGYFIKLGVQEILYKDILLLLVLVFSLVIIISDKIERKLWTSGLLLSTSIILTGLLLALNPLRIAILRNQEYIVPEMSNYSLIMSMRIISYIIIALALKKVVSKGNYNDIVNNVYKFGSGMYFIIFVEWVLKNVFQSNLYNKVIMTIFGEGQFTVNVLLSRGSMNSLQGLMREPAHLAEGIFYFTTIILLSDISVKKKNIVFIVSLLILLISGSFSSLLFIISIIFIFSVRKGITPTYVMIFILVVIFITPFVVTSSIFQYYFHRLVNSINFLNSYQSDLLLTSEGYRINSILETFKLLYKRPLFGIGLGMPYSYGYLSMLMSSIGIVGSYLWYRFTFKIFGEFKILSSQSLIFFTLIVVWFFTGSMSYSYSVITLVVAYGIGKSKRPIKNIS